MSCSYNNKGKPCQFQVPESLLLNRADSTIKNWCKYHIPMEDAVNAAYGKNSWSDDKISEFNNEIYNYLESDFFSSVIDFSGVIFPGNIDFSNKRIVKKIIFDEAKFIGDINFEETKFSDTVFFTGAVFYGRANFENTIFESKVFLNGITSKKPISFIKATFIKYVDFQGCNFSHVSIFSSCKFHDEVYFNNAVFSRALFTNVNFVGQVFFNDTVHNGTLDFSNSKFNSDAFFENKDVGGMDAVKAAFDYMIFDGSKFLSVCNFNNRTFMNATSFESVEFNIAPEFHNSVLHQDTRFINAIFNDVNNKSVGAYRTLKLAMENIRDRREEGKFFILEQKCIRSGEVDLFTKFISWLYEVLSNYGQSISKPVVALIILFLAFGVNYSIIASPVVSPELPVSLKIIQNGMQFSLEQIVNPLHIWKNSGSVLFDGKVTFGVKILTLFQSVLSLSLIALFILSLRWNFKKG